MKQITLLIVDDHEIFRNGIVELMNKEQGLDVIATASNGSEAIEMASKVNPDVIIMDISMPEVNGLEASERILKDNPTQKIILFSLYDNNEYICESLKLGVMGYILKDSPNKVFISAIKQVAEGMFFYSGALTNAVISEYRSLKNMKSSEYQDSGNEHVHLSSREKEILKYIKDGYTNKEISQLYGVSLRTVEAHRLNIMRKFRVNQIDSAIERAIKLEYI